MKLLSNIVVRHFRSAPNNKGFFARVFEDVKKDEDLKNRLSKFRQETKKLEETDALKRAREKFKQVEASTRIFEKAKDAEIFKKISTSARGLSKQGEYLKETAAFKRMSQELDNAEMLSLYRAPKELMKRSERSSEKVVEPNDTARSIELHKDTKWSQNWKKFKEENPYFNKVFEFKMKYDESDNPLVRVTRNFVDKISDTVGGVFQTTDLSNVLTEICKVDPNFDINLFLKDCEKIIIPTILEAMCQNRDDILSDWCYEAVFNVLSQPQKEAQKQGLRIHSKILDLQNLELAMGKMMDQGPVLVVTFHAQQLSYVLDSKGNVVEGDPDKIVQNTYVMAFCRDQSDLNPSTAWRLIDVAMQQSQFMF